MFKPVLVTQVSEDTIEVLTDYQTTVVSASVVNGSFLSIIKDGNKDDGLLGINWSLEGMIVDSEHLTLMTKTKGHNNEYTFEL